MSRQADTDRLYRLLDDLAASVGGPRLLAHATQATGWPQQGVYFFLEPGELRRNGQPRVVRVGTHGLTTTSTTTLWKRLSQHRGHVSGSNPGGGNHRGAVLGLHVGAALIARGDVTDVPLQAWLSPQPLPQWREAERGCERAVSRYIRQMPVLSLPVPTREDGSSDRGVIEAACIALLSTATGGVDPASNAWLGRHAASQAVPASGLWNVRHVHEGYDARALDVLESHVAASCS
jgi:hypothetical protein